MRRGDDAFDADAVLARGREDAFHEDGEHVVFQVGGGEGVEEHGRVFAAEFHADGREGAGGRGADGVRDGPRADEGYVGYPRVGSEVVGGARPAGDGLD